MSRKGENIYKRKDGRWEARYIHHYEDGKAKYGFLYGKTYSEVREKKRSALSCEDKGHTSASKRRITFQCLCLMWLSEKKTAVKASSYARYTYIIEHYLNRMFGNLSLDSIKESDIHSAFSRLKSSRCNGEKCLSEKTISDIICIMKSILKFGYENNYLNTVLSIPKGNSKPSKAIKVITSDSLEKMNQILWKAGTLTALGILIALYTGVRIGELCGLMWGDIDFQNAYVAICRIIERIADIDATSSGKTKVIIDKPKTKNSKRVIPLPSLLLEHLRSFRKGDDIFILTGTKAYVEPRTFYSRYKTFLHHNHFDDYTFHELRHTFATQCIDCDFDIKSLSEILGHSNVSTTMNFYVHPTLKMKQKQMERLITETLSSSIF